MSPTPADARALDASLDRAALTEATARRTTLALLEEVLETEARVAALADHAQTLREVLLARGREYREREGMVPTWRAPIGQVVLSEPKAKLAVTDREAFSGWAAVSHPDQVTGVLRVPIPQLPLLLAVARGVEGLDFEAIDLATDVDAAWERAFVKGCGLAEGSVFAPDTGDEVPGVQLLPAGPPTLSVRPDAEVKARLIAEVRAQVLATLPPALDLIDPAHNPPALAGDPVEDLVVDPAEGVVRVGIDHTGETSWMAVRAADGTVQMLEVHDVHLPEPQPSSPGKVVDTAAVFTGEHQDAGPAPDYDDAPVADADAGPRWHAEQLAANPRLAFTLNAMSGAKLRELAAELGLHPFTADAKRPVMAREIRTRVEQLTTATAVADVQAEGGQG
jgi:hypothetical protein